MFFFIVFSKLHIFPETYWELEKNKNTSIYVNIICTNLLNLKDDRLFLISQSLHGIYINLCANILRYDSQFFSPFGVNAYQRTLAKRLVTKHRWRWKEGRKEKTKIVARIFGTSTSARP